MAFLGKSHGDLTSRGTGSPLCTPLADLQQPRHWAFPFAPPLPTLFKHVSLSSLLVPVESSPACCGASPVLLFECRDVSMEPLADCAALEVGEGASLPGAGCQGPGLGRCCRQAPPSEPASPRWLWFRFSQCWKPCNPASSASAGENPPPGMGHLFS